ncbi:MAG: hypothetical protein RLY71_2827 [Pseudomonadota bacterium]|jgi:membrane AbrB-like protein
MAVARLVSLQRSPVWRWVLLAGLSGLCAFGLEQLHLPAAWLMGPMLAAIALAVAGLPVRLPRPLFFGAQGVVGVMMASHLPVTILPQIAVDWPLFLAGTLSTLLVSSLLGWLMSRTGALPGTTAIWGSSPGAAAAMTLMSEFHGADMRLVAFMQYLRVLCCVLAASLVAHHFHLDATPPALALHSDIPPLTLAASLAVALLGMLAGWRLNVPGGPLLVPLALGIVAQLSGLVQLEMPPPLLALGYALIGCGIGLRFTPEVLRHAARVLPMALASVLTLVAVNAGVAVLLVWLADLDPLTAFLATSPGGADSVAIIAASSAASSLDAPFVMAMQILRFLVVVTLGPALARWLSARGQPPDSQAARPLQP